MSHKWSLKRLMHQYKQRVRRPENRAYYQEELRKDIEYFISSEPTPFALRVFTLQLDLVARWEASLGVPLVFEGNETGWSHILASTEYRGWKVRILVALGELSDATPSIPSLNGTCCCLAASIALRQDHFAHWCGSWLIRRIETSKYLLLGSGWDETPFAPFMVQLYALWRGQNVDVRRPGICPLGVYQQVFDAWESEQAFARALEAICDYHCARSYQRGNNEFQRTPYDVFPAEILALKRIRHELGLPWVRLEHPLLDNPLAHPPEHIVAAPDKLIQRAISWVRSAISWQEEL